jgi:hypothetical protein
VLQKTNFQGINDYPGLIRAYNAAGLLRTNMAALPEGAKPREIFFHLMCPFDSPKTQLDLQRRSPHLTQESCPCYLQRELFLNSKPRGAVFPFSLFNFDLRVLSLRLLENHVR